MAENLVALQGSVPVNNHRLIGPVDPKSQLEVTVRLRRKSEEGLPTLEEFMKGKRAQGITRQILADRYGSDAKDATAVQAWAKRKGLSVSRSDLGMRQLHLVGSADAMAKAFGVKLSMYMHARTHTHFRCPESDIKIPESLAGVITGVFGLNDMPVVVRHGAIRKVTHLGHQAAADPKTLFPGSFYPNEVSALYNFPDAKGGNQRVAVLEFGGGFDPAVLTSYFTHNIGLQTTPTVNAISVLNTQMQVNDGATGEVYLDIEVIGAMAPQAIIDVYFAPWSGVGYLNAVTQSIHNNDYAAISISYGLDEDLRGSANNPGWPSLNHAVDEAFRDAAAIGLPVFVSSGDQGSGSDRGFTSDGNEITVQSASAHAGYPASSPYATSVGGTLLYAQNDKISNEVVWSELGPVQQGEFQDQSGAMKHGAFYFGGATGGGVSDRYPVPSYQSNAGINPKSANAGNKPGRGIPDVAGNAGATTGYLVSQPPGSQIPIAPVGGTSASAPMWAALMACVRESLETNFNGEVPTFFFNDFVYAAGKSAAFRDIVGGRTFTLGGNGGLEPGQFIPVGSNCSSKANGYSAAEGYDLCTGWGSPNGKAFLTALEAWLKTHAQDTGDAPATSV